MTDEDDSTSCERCEDHLCLDCSTSCHDCGRSCCAECRTACSGCDRDFCGSLFRAMFRVQERVLFELSFGWPLHCLPE